MAKCLHCVRTVCMLRTQRLGYSPKNTCHLFTRGKPGPGVDSPPSTIGDREPSSDDDHVDFSAVVDVAIPIDDLVHLGSRITLKSTKVLVHVLSVGKSTL